MYIAWKELSSDDRIHSQKNITIPNDTHQLHILESSSSRKHSEIECLPCIGSDRSTDGGCGDKAVRVWRIREVTLEGCVACTSEIIASCNSKAIIGGVQRLVGS